MEFIDRDNESKRLRDALNGKKPSFIVIYGRRRLGKSTLIKRVIKESDVYFMADVTESSNQRRLAAIAISAKITGFDSIAYSDWETLLTQFNYRCEAGMTLCLDEFPYLVKSDPSLPSVLQRLIDTKSLKFNLIICGSSQQMIFDTVLSESAPLYGHADEIMCLKPIDASFLSDAISVTPIQAVEEYSVWGGVPRYWELREKFNSLDSAIENLCVNQLGLLYDEIYHLLRDDMRDTIQATTILSFIGNGANKLSEIASRCEKSATTISGPLAKLQRMHLITREIPFLDDFKNSKKGVYYISDPYIRFYFRYIAPYKSFIELGKTEIVNEKINSTFNEFVSKQWEIMCRNYISGNIIDGIRYGMSSRWWGQLTNGNMAEFDVMSESIDGKYLLIGECKWTNAEDADKLTTELMDKASFLPFLKNYKKVSYILFLKDKPLKPSNSFILYPEDITRK